MVRSSAAAVAVAHWGINAFAVRAKDIVPANRYRVGYMDSEEGRPLVRILGMGRSWEEAFKVAVQHPAHEAQKQKTAALREQYQTKAAQLQEAAP